MKDIFERVLSYVRAKHPSMPKMTLNLRCRDIARRRRLGDRRSFCEVGHVPGAVCCSPATGDLNTCHVMGLFLHELGHVLSGSGEQDEADAAVRRIVGFRIFYRGPQTLQWVSPAAVMAIYDGKGL